MHEEDTKVHREMRRVNKGLIVSMLAVIVYSANIWGVSIYFLDEAKNAGCAMEMYQEGEWIVPVFNNELRTDKPVLHYYFMKAGYALFGITPMGARIFSSLMGVLTVLSVFYYVKKIVNEQAAFYSSLILIASIQFAVQFHLAVPDPYLLFFLTTGWLSFYYGWHFHSRKHYYFFYLCVSLAFLTKGPVAILFSGLIVLLFLLVQRNFTWKQMLALRLVEGALIFCLIGAPWYILVGIQTQGEWIDQFFFKHNVSRFTNTMEGHGGFPFISFIILFVGLMPFSFFLPQAIREWWKQKNPFSTFCLLVTLIVVLFFAFSKTILPTYPEPAFPFAAIALGIFFNNMIEAAAKPRRLWIAAIIYLIITIAMWPAGYYALSIDALLSTLAPLTWIFVVLPIGALAGLWLISKHRLQSGIFTYAGSQIVFLLLFFYVLFPAIDERNSVARAINLIGENKTFVYHGNLNPAFVFNLKRPIGEVKPDSLGKGSYLITTEDHADDLGMPGLIQRFESKDLFESSETIVFEVKP
jgi:4-amino-4-deoxy-L-arabinose transferase-like glycosyltransferase